MARNGSGIYSAPAGSWNPAVNATPATLADWQALLNDLVAAMTQSVSKDGQTALTGDLSLGNNKLVNVANPTLPNDAVTASSIQTQSLLNVVTYGTSTAYAVSASPGITAYAAGTSFFVVFHVASGAAPTLQISGLASPPNLVKQIANGTYINIAAGDIPYNHRSRVTLISPTQALVENVVPYLKSTILGTVSQSAGVPAGAIIERGSNANGEYVRFADGTQICWSTGIGSTTAAGPQECGWTFPVAFASAAVIATPLLEPGTGSDIRNYIAQSRYSGTVSGSALFLVYATSIVGYKASAVGRWF
jgi:hypothetical protein